MAVLVNQHIPYLFSEFQFVSDHHHFMVVFQNVYMLDGDLIIAEDWLLHHVTLYGLWGPIIIYLLIKLNSINNCFTVGNYGIKVKYVQRSKIKNL